MALFKSVVDVPRADFENFLRRLADVEGRVAALEYEQKALRDKVLRKIQKGYEWPDGEKKDQPEAPADGLPRFSPFGL